MPELPEITLYRDYVKETSLGKTITKVAFPDASLLQSPKEAIVQALEGSSFKKAERLGKYLGISTTGGKWLILHFGMTGKLSYYSNQEEPKYAKLVLWFEDNYCLAFTCRRKLGKIFLADDLDSFQRKHALGNDALGLSEKEFLTLLEGKTGSIKGVLTDQHLLSGIGNVYADEMLYQSRIHPKTKTSYIPKDGKKELFSKMKTVLETAIAVEGVRENFPESYIIHHRKDGATCPRCRGRIEKIVVGGRSTYFCPSCQIEKK